MRTVMQIIDAAKRGEGEKPTYEELFYTMIALELLATQNDRRAMNLAFGKKQPVTTANLQAAVTESFNLSKKVLNSDPKVWLGPEYDYANPDVQARARTSSKILDAITKRSQENQV